MLFKRSTKKSEVEFLEPNESGNSIKKELKQDKVGKKVIVTDRLLTLILDIDGNRITKTKIFRGDCFTDLSKTLNIFASQQIDIFMAESCKNGFFKIYTENDSCEIYKFSDLVSAKSEVLEEREIDLECIFDRLKNDIDQMGDIE
jgi:hypothetical protein